MEERDIYFAPREPSLSSTGLQEEDIELGVVPQLSIDRR